MAYGRTDRWTERRRQWQYPQPRPQGGGVKINISSFYGTKADGFYWNNEKKRKENLDYMENMNTLFEMPHVIFIRVWHFNEKL